MLSPKSWRKLFCNGGSSFPNSIVSYECSNFSFFINKVGSKILLLGLKSSLNSLMLFLVSITNLDCFILLAIYIKRDYTLNPFIFKKYHWIYRINWLILIIWLNICFIKGLHFLNRLLLFHLPMNILSLNKDCCYLTNLKINDFHNWRIIQIRDFVLKC